MTMAVEDVHLVVEGIQHGLRRPDCWRF
jgi:hypothetical protein